jgi:hypothetical protein
MRRTIVTAAMLLALFGGTAASCDPFNGNDNPPAPTVELPDCDQDDLKEGDPDCDLNKLKKTSTPTPAKTTTTTKKAPTPAKTTTKKQQ